MTPMHCFFFSLDRAFYNSRSHSLSNPNPKVHRGVTPSVNWVDLRSTPVLLHLRSKIWILAKQNFLFPDWLEWPKNGHGYWLALFTSNSRVKFTDLSSISKKSQSDKKESLPDSVRIQRVASHATRTRYHVRHDHVRRPRGRQGVRDRQVRFLGFGGSHVEARRRSGVTDLHRYFSIAQVLDADNIRHLRCAPYPLCTAKPVTLTQFISPASPYPTGPPARCSPSSPGAYRAHPNVSGQVREVSETLRVFS